MYIFICTTIFFHFTYWQNDYVGAYPQKEPLVTTKYGEIRGTTLLSRNGREFNAYRGIPYAKPPVGKLRFKAPEPSESWEFPLDATKNGPFCIQKTYFFANPKIQGQEDCLYLNVYVPKQLLESDKILPVMVFIHWGGFFMGRGTSDYLGPEYLMDKDIILVTFNYRLGVLGFLSTLDDEAPGNYAFKDQVAALKWVQENIENFGGNKNEVTLFGQSAGSGSVHYHILSPLSKGLFKRAISQSGTALNLWAKPLNALQANVTAAQAAFVGCDTNLNDSQKLIQCLRSIDAETLVASGDHFKYFSIEPVTPYTPVIELRTDANPNPFITKEPIEYILSDEFQSVPWIIGTVEEEGLLRAEPLLRQANIRETLNANFSTLMPQMLLLSISTGPNTRQLWNDIKEFYLEGQDYVDIENSDRIRGFIDLYTDRSMAYGIYQSILIHTLKNHSPIWFYNFNYRGQYSYGDLFAATGENINYPWGVSHCDELLYLFKSPALFPNPQNDLDIVMSEKMVNIWTNFAILGVPDLDQNLQWEYLKFNESKPLLSSDIYYLNITGHYDTDNVEFSMQNCFNRDRMFFWFNHSLVENYNLFKK